MAGERKVNRKTFGKFILQRRESEGCNQVSLKIMWRKSGKNAGFRGKTAFKVSNGLALPWKTIRAGNEAATSPSPDHKTIGASYG